MGAPSDRAGGLRPPEVVRRRDLMRQVTDKPGVLTTVLVLCVLPLGAYALVYLPLKAHLALSIGMMGVGLVLVRRLPKMRIAAMLLSVAASVRYLSWRGAETLYFEPTADGAFSLLLFGAELYGFFILFGGYFQTAIVRNRKPEPLIGPKEKWPPVDIYIPTYNEPIDVLRRTVVGACAVDYPKLRVYILDDTPAAHADPKKNAVLAARRRGVRELAEETGSVALRRPNNKGAKAGNINHALAHTQGELIRPLTTSTTPTPSSGTCTSRGTPRRSRRSSTTASRRATTSGTRPSSAAPARSSGARR